jgi:signal peptidase I
MKRILNGRSILVALGLLVPLAPPLAAGRWSPTGRLATASREAAGDVFPLDCFSGPGIEGESTLPTLSEGRLGGINRLAYLWREPERGDLVGIWTGTGLMAKHVVGLPGERLAVHDGVLRVNGVALAEPYVEFSDRWRQVREGRLDPGCFLVAGDNRSASVMVAVGRARIVGRLVTFASLWRKHPQVDHREPISRIRGGS